MNATEQHQSAILPFTVSFLISRLNGLGLGSSIVVVHGEDYNISEQGLQSRRRIMYVKGMSKRARTPTLQFVRKEDVTM